MKTYSKRRFKKIYKSFFRTAARTGAVHGLHVFKRQKPEITEELFSQGMAGKLSYEIDQDILGCVENLCKQEAKEDVNGEIFK